MACTDYEYKFDKLFNNYKKIAPKFSESFSPFLENGLNIGQQIYYLYKRKLLKKILEINDKFDYPFVIIESTINKKDLNKIFLKSKFRNYIKLE